MWNLLKIDAKFIALYYLFVFLIIASEILLGASEIEKWLFFIITILNCIVIFHQHYLYAQKYYKNIILFLLYGILVNLFSVFFVVIIGVNFKLLAGGSL